MKLVQHMQAPQPHFFSQDVSTTVLHLGQKILIETFESLASFGSKLTCKAEEEEEKKKQTKILQLHG